MHGLAGHPVPAGDLAHRRTGDDFHDGVIALLHNAQLHEHGPATPYRDQPHGGACPGGRCQASGEANVSTISRSRTADPAVSQIGEYFLYGFKGARSAPDPGHQLALEQRHAKLHRPKCGAAPAWVGRGQLEGTAVCRAPTPLLGPLGHSGVGALQVLGNQLHQLDAVTLRLLREPCKSSHPPGDPSLNRARSPSRARLRRVTRDALRDTLDGDLPRLDSAPIGRMART